MLCYFFSRETFEANKRITKIAAALKIISMWKVYRSAWMIENKSVDNFAFKSL
jgi:hypothetical protein